MNGMTNDHDAHAPSDLGAEGVGPGGPGGPQGPRGRWGRRGDHGPHGDRGGWERGGPRRGPGGHGGHGRGGRPGRGDGQGAEELAHFFAEMANAFGSRGGRRGFGPGADGRGPGGGFGQGFGPGFGHGFGPDFGPGGPRRGGPRGDGRRRARRGDVRTGILLLVGEESRNGYAIMRELAERSGGEWTPSSGAIYPALSQLEDEGLIELDFEAGPKHYRLTEAGREEAAGLEGKRAPWDLDSGEGEGSDPEGADARAHSQEGLDLGNSIRQMMLALRSVMATRDEALIGQAREEIDGLRKRLYALLAEED